jgi:hypothetical protein
MILLSPERTGSSGGAWNEITHHQIRQCIFTWMHAGTGVWIAWNTSSWHYNWNTAEQWLSWRWTCQPIQLQFRSPLSVMSKSIFQPSIGLQQMIEMIYIYIYIWMWVASSLNYYTIVVIFVVSSANFCFLESGRLWPRMSWHLRT